MPWRDPEVRKWIEMLLFSGLAGVGGALGYIYREVISDKRPNPWRAIVEGSAASFCGVLVFLACDAMNFGMQWTGVIVGALGWAGASVTMKVLEKLTFKKLGVSEREPD